MVLRLLPDGSLDPSFGTGGYVTIEPMGFTRLVLDEGGASWWSWPGARSGA